jgi:hypothetical protein
MNERPLTIERLEKIEGKNPIYRVTMTGKTFECRAEDLLSCRRFRMIAFKHLDRFPPDIPTPAWEEYLNELLPKMKIVEAPTDDERTADRSRRARR